MRTWLRDGLIRRLAVLLSHLSYVRTDPFKQGHRMLAGTLPVDHVEVEEGGNDWGTWLALCHCVVDTSPFEISSVGDV